MLTDGVRLTADVVLRHFQSLGDTCEFAGFQERATQKRPMTLLSNASCKLAELLDGLGCRFEGVGDPGLTKLEWKPAWQEYRLAAEPYFGRHSGHITQITDPIALALAEADAAAMLGLQRRRLLADLTDPQLIFVFASAAPGTDRDAAQRLLAALRRCGPAGLFCVVPAADPAQVGAVEWLGDGLQFGWIDRFGQFPPNRPWVGSYEVWRRLCTTALAQHMQHLAT